MKRSLLTNKKSKWAKNRNVVLRGEQLCYNVSLQIKYQQALKRLILPMTTQTEKAVEKLFRSDDFEKLKKQMGMDASLPTQAKRVVNKLRAKFVQLFATRASSIANQMLSNMTQSSTTNLHASLRKLSGGLSLKTSVVPPGMTDIINASINENVALISSIPQTYLTKVTAAVMRSITTGNGLNSLLPEIRKFSQESKRKTELLALDQTRKAYNNVNKIRMQAIGIKQFVWVHSAGSQKPRKSHIKLAVPPDNIYSFSDLPIINREQVERGYEAEERGIPGQAINCRCTMIPVLNLGDDEG